MIPLHTALGVYRWHVDPILGRLLQTTADHSARMCGLALDLWPDTSADLLRACILHDAPECVTGDLPRLARACYGGLDMAQIFAERHVADENGWAYILSPVDTERLGFLDSLEPYMFAARHDPARLASGEWPAARQWLINCAGALGCGDKLAGMIT